MLLPAIPVRLILLADFTARKMSVRSGKVGPSCGDSSRWFGISYWLLVFANFARFYVAVAMDLMKGLEFAMDLLFLSLQSESDSSNVIAALKNKQQSTSFGQDIAL
ncbi:hypothetical protein TSUD_310190 [Trifolium subterraneum]|uniref:Uncharacterized protein n=1 Tax=Trifolium subterraneum TaxID=3900 RepID=A0A2Z6MGG9_TRISU|nr:hypothetical protein TSUD_310190 [Trifolium subterraneum]